MKPTECKVRPFILALMRRLLLIAMFAPILGACEEAPLKPGDRANLTAAVKKAQKEFVRESTGTDAYECFTLADYQSFKEMDLPRKITADLQHDRKFMEGVLALQKLPEDARAAFIQDLRKPLRPTWAELGRISPEGQTEAGNAAELDIANAVADELQSMLKQDDAELEAIFRKR